MSDFLTGGQVTAHRFRMFSQVTKIMAKVTIGGILATFILTFYNNISAHDWSMVPAIIKCELWKDIDSNKTITYKDYNNAAHKETIKYFIYNKHKKLVENKFAAVLSQAVDRSLLVLIIGFVGSIIFFWHRGKLLKSSDQIRGSFLIPESDLVKRVNKHNKQFKGIKPYTLAGVPFAATGKGNAYTPGEQAHTLVLGSTGTGKTKVIQNLVSQLQKRGQKAIVVDIKGDYISYFYDASRGDVILNPLDKRASNWSFFSEANILTGFDTIAKTLIHDTSRDQFWSNAARRVFVELAKLYWNENLSLSEFADKILNKDTSELEKLLENTPAKHLVDGKADKTVVCVLMMLAVHLAPLKLYTKNDKRFSITDWVNDDSKSNFLFISTSAEMKESLNTLVQMQVDIAISALCSSRKKSLKPIWFILDELPYFDKSLPNLKDGLTTSRSFGGAFVLGTQDMSSLSKIYGHELSHVIANNCRNKFIMNVDDNYTAKWCSEIMGEGEIEEWNEGISYGAHEMRDGVSANKYKTIKRTVLPSEFSQLKTGQGYIKLPGFQPSLITFKDCYFQNKNKAFIEDEELKRNLKLDLEKAQARRKELELLISKKSDAKKTKELIKQIESSEEKLLEDYHF